jgi:hypothetical protein
VGDGRRVRVVIARGTGRAAEELAEAICRGASRFAHVRTRTLGDLLPRELALCDVVVLTAPSGRRRSAMAPLLAALPPSGARFVVVTESSWRPLARSRGWSLARLLRRRHLALLMPPRTFRLDRRGLLLGDEWERARDLGEDLVVEAGGSVRLEPVLPDAA